MVGLLAEKITGSGFGYAVSVTEDGRHLEGGAHLNGLAEEIPGSGFDYSLKKRILMAVTFFIMHTSWGIGFLYGLMLKKYLSKKLPHEE